MSQDLDLFNTYTTSPSPYDPATIAEIEECLDNLAKTTNNHYILKWLLDAQMENNPVDVPLEHQGLSGIDRDPLLDHSMRVRCSTPNCWPIQSMPPLSTQSMPVEMEGTSCGSTQLSPLAKTQPTLQRTCNGRLEQSDQTGWTLCSTRESQPPPPRPLSP